MERSRTRRVVCGLVAVAFVSTAPVTLAGDAAQVRAQAFQELSQGVAAYKRGDYALAVQRLESSASVALNSFRAHYYLGLALIGDRRYGEALGPLEVALDLDPGHLQSNIATGDAFLKMGDLNEASASFYRAMKLRPEYPPALDGLARILESQDRVPEAVQHFRRAIESNRGYAQAYTHLGDLYLRQGRYEEAVLLLEEAVSVRPDFAPGLNRLALAYGRLGLDNQAVAMIQRAMELEPNNAVHPATLGEIQLAKDFLAAAQTSFENALQLDASLPQARKGLAEVFRRRGEYLAAMEQLKAALLDGRLDAAMRIELDEFRAKLELEEQDVHRLEELIGDGTATAEDFGRLASIYASRRMWSHAGELQRFAPEGREQRERLAYMLFQSGLVGEAHDLYAELAATGDDGDLALNSGVTLALLGDDLDAVDAFRLALDRNPDFARAHLYLGNALLRLDREEQAVVAYLAYLDETNRGEAAERVRRILKQLDPDSMRDLAPLSAPAAALDVEPEAEGDSP